MSIFEKNKEGVRPVFEGAEKMQRDDHFKDYLLFHEYFDGESGRGLGASHQSGWTALIAVYNITAKYIIAKVQPANQTEPSTQS